MATLQFTRVQCKPSHSSSLHSQELASISCRNRVHLSRNGDGLHGKRASCCCFSGLRAPQGLVQDGLRRTRAHSEAKVEVVKSDHTTEEDDDDEIEIANTSLPPRFLKLMQDAGNPPNYWAMGFGLAIAILARNSIWAELKRWITFGSKLVVLAGVVVVDAVIAVGARLIIWGGDPAINAIVAVTWIGRLLNGWLRFIADATPIGPTMFAVALSSLVLVVGEVASNTYSSEQKQYPSRIVVDIAFLLGLAGFVGIVPEEAMLLGLAAITAFLLGMRRVNPVAGFSPAAAVLVAFTRPLIRYPVLVSFVGSSLYRYWKVGCMSLETVRKERITEYPRVLAGLVYLVGYAIVARTFFYAVDLVWASILLPRI